MPHIHSTIQPTLDAQVLYDTDTDDANDIEDLDYLYGELFANFTKERWEHSRINWSLHTAQLFHENRFAREYRMSYGAWEKLRSILHPFLKRNFNYSSRTFEPITVDIIMGVGMRYLTGGAIQDVRHIVGISRSEAYACLDLFIDGIVSAEELTIRLPSSHEEWETKRRGFVNIGATILYHGCVEAVDGFCFCT